jgi:carbon storage regulator
LCAGELQGCRLCFVIFQRIEVGDDMLVLTRRVDESIRIGDDIRITVVKIKGTQQICVGVDAPRDVPVLREELITEREPKGEASTTADSE